MKKKHYYFQMIGVWITISIIALLSGSTQAITGFDCVKTTQNITTVSLLSIGECNYGEIEPNTEEVYIQLLQQSENKLTQIRSCRIKVNQHIKYFGGASHTAEVAGGD